MATVDPGAGPTPPFEVPSWCVPPDPSHDFSLDVIKEGVVVDSVPLAGRAVRLFGRQPDVVHTVLDHPSVSRCHAAVLHREGGELFLMDLGSTHGSLLNRRPIRPHVFAPLPIGSVFRLGQSSRLFCVNGPPELLPPEHEPIRAHMPPPPARGSAPSATAATVHAPRALRTAGDVSWGQVEDADEEDGEGATDGADAEANSTLEGLLQRADRAGVRRNERQAQLLDKLEKRRARLTHLEDEAARIQAKASGGSAAGAGGGRGQLVADDGEEDGGGLTAGQRAQLDRCLERAEEHRKAAAELEDLLVDSLRRQLGMRPLDTAGAGGASGHAGARRADGDEGSGGSDSGDDEFFDRTQRARKRGGGGGGAAAGGGQAAQALSADSLRAERERLEREERQAERSLLELRATAQPAAGGGGEAADPLEQFMAANSSAVLQHSAAEAERRLAAARAALQQNRRLLELASSAMDAALPRARPAAVAHGDAPAPKRRALGAAPAPPGFVAHGSGGGGEAGGDGGGGGGGGGDGAEAVDGGKRAAAIVGVCEPAAAAASASSAARCGPALEAEAEAAGGGHCTGTPAVAAHVAAARTSAAAARAEEWQRALSAMHGGGDGQPQQPSPDGARADASRRSGAQAAGSAPRRFVAAREFCGSRRGMVFQMGPQGLGYYEDRPHQAEELAGAGQPPGRAVSTAPVKEAAGAMAPPPAALGRRAAAALPHSTETAQGARGLGWSAADASAPSLRAHALDEAQLQRLRAQEREQEAAVRPGLNARPPPGRAGALSEAQMEQPGGADSCCAGDGSSLLLAQRDAARPPAVAAHAARRALARDLPEAEALGSDSREPAMWMPPQGQTGDGRTALNAKLGY